MRRFAILLFLATRAFAQPYNLDQCTELKGTLVSKSEKGTPLTVSGRVLDANGKPVANAYIRAFQADANGIYTNDRTRRPRICGVARTGVDGVYRFTTIRPGRYPNSREPEHIHFEIWGDGIAKQQAVLHFADDPYAKKEHARKVVNGTVERDLVLD